MRGSVGLGLAAYVVMAGLGLFGTLRASRYGAPLEALIISGVMTVGFWAVLVGLTLRGHRNQHVIGSLVSLWFADLSASHTLGDLQKFDFGRLCCRPNLAESLPEIAVAAFAGLLALWALRQAGTRRTFLVTLGLAGLLLAWFGYGNTVALDYNIGKTHAYSWLATVTSALGAGGLMVTLYATARLLITWRISIPALHCTK